MIRRAYDANNERALLKFNGPYRLPSRDHLVIIERGSQVIYKTKVIKVGIGVTPSRKTSKVEGEGA